MINDDEGSIAGNGGGGAGEDDGPVRDEHGEDSVHVSDGADTDVVAAREWTAEEARLAAGELADAEQEKDGVIKLLPRKCFLGPCQLR